MGESAAQLHPVLVRVKEPGLFFSQREVLQEEDSQVSRGHLRCNHHPRLTLQVSDAGISLPNITPHTSPRMTFRIARLSMAKVKLPSSSPNSLLCMAPCHTDHKAALSPDIGEGAGFPPFHHPLPSSWIQQFTKCSPTFLLSTAHLEARLLPVLTLVLPAASSLP